MKEDIMSHRTVSLTPEYVFDYRKGSILRKDGNELFLNHRLKSFITILIENKNDVVTRDEFMTHVWKDIIVNDESITKAASDFRKFLVKNNIVGLELITIRRLGYKLEINEVIISEKGKINFLTLSLKIIGYVLLAMFVMIILIRAAKY